MTVADDGAGCRVTASREAGIRGMRERAALIGAELTVVRQRTGVRRRATVALTVVATETARRNHR